jgi:hypothetical protein
MGKATRALPLVLVLAGSLAASRAAASPGLYTELVASGLSEPVYVAAPRGDSRLFVVERGGKIKIVEEGILLPTEFLDITALVSTTDSFGLFGLAFPPDHTTSGFFYVYYMNNSSEAVIARYSVSANPDVANAGSGETVLSLPRLGTDHNGGTIAFSPVDGYLYIALGDGGTGPFDPMENAQDPQDLLGKILRLDVAGGAGTTYSVPSDNPFVGVPSVRAEIWAMGMRNPFRWSFDRLNGDLWIGDVGQELKEEINYESAGDGGHNYGWDVMEGTLCVVNDPWPPPPVCNDPSLRLPLYEYGHDESKPLCSGTVIGGHVHRGHLGPFYGLYFFADFCTEKIWTLDPHTLEVVERTSDLSPARGGETIDLIVGIAEDGFGELYVVDLGGEIFRIVLPGETCPFYASPDQTDTDGDGRGDACECTDQNGDGLNTVSDLLAINQAIFNPSLVTPLCDGNNDGDCNVGDILAANVEIFSPGNTSTCSRQPVPGP